MMLFWILAAAMTLAGLAFVLVPLLRARAGAGPDAIAANLDVLRSQRRELEADVANGTLPTESRAEALAELVERAQDDLAARTAPATRPAKRPWIIAIAIGVALPALAFGVYLAIGMPAATDARMFAAPSRPATDAQVVALVENLARKVHERPDDAQGWTLLARSMAALGRFKESAEAYEHLATLVPPDAQLLADYADALGMAGGRSLAGKPTELVKKALEIDPRNHKALALAGTAALDAADFGAATGYFQRLAAELPADSEDAKQLQAILLETREKALAAGQRVAKAPATPKPAAAATSGVSGAVSVAPSVAAKVSPSDTLFIFARSEGGPKVPLAVMRASARELPMRFALDDSMAMAPSFTLSTAQAVRVEARISRSGNALPQTGDLVGASGVVKPGARDIAIVIDKVVP